MFGMRFEIPHLVGEEQFTIVMRGPKIGDAEEFAKLLGDYEAQQFVIINGSPTIKDEEEWLEKARTNNNQIVWIVTVVKDDQEVFIGTTALSLDHNNVYSSGILLANKAWWGKGIASATHKFRTWFAFNELGAFVIRSSYLADNVASGRALRSVGYVDCGAYQRWRLSGGKWRDEILLMCYNPAAIPLLWPGNDVPPEISQAIVKTKTALAQVQDIIKPR